MVKDEVDELEIEDKDLEDETVRPIEAEFKYINRTEESWLRSKIPKDQWPHHVVYTEPHRFLIDVDLARGPIIQTLIRAVRIKAIDFSDPSLHRKEFVVFYFNWYGKGKNGEEGEPVGE